MFVSTRGFQVTVPALLFDPAYYLFDFAPQHEFTKFLVVEERMLEQAPFIDIRFEPLAQAQFWVSTKELLALEGLRDVPRPQPLFIFHHAFVCSTLLAKCLGRIDAFFSLKEPWILRRIADYRRANRDHAASPQWRETFCKYVMLLCRNFRTGRIPVIKATNVANNLMGDVLHFMPGRSMLYLYSDLESFLISNLRKTDETQQKMPALARGFLGDSDFLQKFPQMSELSRLSLLQVCALTWLVNLYNFKDSLREHENAPVRTLDAKDFLDDLPGSLGLLSRFFGHVPDSADLQQMMDPQVIQTNAKDPSMPYGKEQRQSEMNRIRNRYEQELKGAMAWIDPLARELGVLDFLHSRRLAA